MASTHVKLSGGVLMPLIGLGTWKLRGKAAYRTVRHALDLGYRHIDTATMYGNEAEVGRALRDSGVPYEDVFVTTKLPPRNAGREGRTLTASLRALDTDYVDLWLVHWPPNGTARPETWRRFIQARDQGLARAIGVSNYSTAQIDELVAALGVAPSVDQIPWNPSLFDPVQLAELHQRGVILEGYSPFRNTDLRNPTLLKIAADHDVSAAQVVLRWHVEHGIVAIPKSANFERLAANLDVFGFSLSGDEVAAIDALAG